MNLYFRPQRKSRHLSRASLMALMCSLAGLIMLATGCASAPEWPGPSRPFRAKIHQIPGTIEAEDFDEGGEGVAYHDQEPKNLGAPYRDTGVDIEPRADASGKYDLGWTRASEWLVYTVDVTESGTYTIEMRVASGKQGGKFHLEFNGVDRTGPIEVPDTGGWETMKPISKSGVRLAAGRYAMKAVMDQVGASGSIGDIDFFRFVKS